FLAAAGVGQEVIVRRESPPLNDPGALRVNSGAMRSAGRGSRGEARARALAVVVLAGIGGLATVAAAQPKGAGHAPKKPPAAVDAGATGSRGFGRSTAPAVLAPSSAGAGSTDAGVVEARTLDGGTRVFKFKELDIEGRLKSPQLVYFLRRVRAEFGAQDLGHRSFLREMSETRKEPSF
ncbi:MAG: hypothetical protein ACRENE_33650, partial [Polyangiaceae bacterium]